MFLISQPIAPIQEHADFQGDAAGWPLQVENKTAIVHETQSKSFLNLRERLQAASVVGNNFLSMSRYRRENIQKR